MLDNFNGCRHSLPDGFMRAPDARPGGKPAPLCDFGDVGQGCADAMHSDGARDLFADIDPLCARMTCMEGAQE
eukprot:6702792-Lingulodinium_polyedra.AAC.1